MKTIKHITLAIFMTFAALPAWGMYLSSVIAENPFTIKPKNSLMPFEEKNGLIPFEKKYAFESIRVFRNSFGVIPSLYFSVVEKKEPGEVRLWKENNRIEGALILQERSPVETYIHYLAVDNNTQHQGVGTKMLNALEKERASTCPQSTCIITLHSYARALQFYEKKGFTCGHNNKCTKKIPSKNVAPQSIKDILIWNA